MIAKAFTALVLLTAPALSHASDFTLCPDLAAVGKGSAEWEDAKRCVRVMAARYSVSGQSPADIATAAIGFCEDRKIAPLVESESPDQEAKLRGAFLPTLRDIAIQTVVEMRTANCASKPGLYDHIGDPIDRPHVLGNR